MFNADLANLIYCHEHCQESDCDKCPLHPECSWRTFVGVLLSCCLAIYPLEFFDTFPNLWRVIAGMLLLVLLFGFWIFLLRLDSRETERR